MFKKAGIIVGSVFILLAIIVVVIANSNNGGDERVSNDNKLDSLGTNPSVQEEVVTSTNTVTQPVVTGSEVMIPINTETLPQPKVTETIGVVQNKTVVLIGDELFYSLKMLVGDENIQLSYIVSSSGYDAVEIGTKCKITLACYTVANGSSYYLINGMSTIE